MLGPVLFLTISPSKHARPWQKNGIIFAVYRFTRKGLAYVLDVHEKRAILKFLRHKLLPYPGKVALWAKMLAEKADDLSSIPGIHMVGENGPL